MSRPDIHSLDRLCYLNLDSPRWRLDRHSPQQGAEETNFASPTEEIHHPSCPGSDGLLRNGNGTPCRSVAINAMKSLIVALLAVITLFLSALSPAPVSALVGSTPSMKSSSPLPIVFMAKQSDAKAKTGDGRPPSASADLKGNSGDKTNAVAKQAKGSTMTTATNPQKANKSAEKSS